MIKWKKEEKKEEKGRNEMKRNVKTVEKHQELHIGFVYHSHGDTHFDDYIAQQTYCLPFMIIKKKRVR